MLNKIISVIMSVAISLAGFVNSSLNSVIDGISEMIFGIPYTIEAVKADFFNDISDSDVVELDDGTGFVNNKIAVFLNEDSSFFEKIDFFKSSGGIIIGWCAPANLYVLRYSAMNYDKIIDVCSKLSDNEQVALSMPVFAFKNTENFTPDDSFEFSNSSMVKWDECNPSGSNWWLEAINARQAWDYSDYFSKINVGIVDTGFDVTHPDLAGKISFSSSKQEEKNIAEGSHGNHVAGIIGANSNNGIGISGICDNSNLICVDWLPTIEQRWNTELAIFFGFAELVKAGAKVVNLSLGTASSKAGNKSGIWERYFVSAAVSLMMSSLLSKGYDFVAVQSAGNGNEDGNPIDAANNGHFCSINDRNILNGFTRVTHEDILDRIIIVASANNAENGKYVQAKYTNVGSRICIAAPGTDIYSCYIDGKYGNMSGTSMAAPVVAGVASLVWSVNPSFTGADIKDIICGSTNSVAKINEEATYVFDDLEFFDYPMVNAKLAVEEAIRRTDSSVGTVVGSVEAGFADEIVFNGVSHTIFSDGTYSFVAGEGSGTAQLISGGETVGSVDVTITAGQTFIAGEYNLSSDAA